MNRIADKDVGEGREPGVEASSMTTFVLWQVCASAAFCADLGSTAGAGGQAIHTRGQGG